MYADYNLITYDNINYTVDMVRLKTNLKANEFYNLEKKISFMYEDLVKKKYTCFGISEFKYNYNIEFKEGSSFWFGFIHNSELINKDKSVSNENTTFNFTVEFNPNKVPIRSLLKVILNLSTDWVVKSIDMAMDLKINIMDLCGIDKGRKKDFRLFTQGLDNRTYYIGRTDNRIKIYNKKIESGLDYDLTRIEITSKINKNIKDINFYNYNVKLPELYLNDYMYTFSDYKDKTLLAVLYAVQSGYNINDLTRRMRDKVKSLLEGNYKINLQNIYCTNVLHNCIDYIFNIENRV